ncbi:2-oxo acid dehydrogenase subunit E2 [Nonomuraea soli]|uniref:Dihydrolipoamide acetyltransferase component of pyruvate dehydrogenase complex n=1 Tax=Nonomuraea soli TaxID=1032476 RepID=A0A7W0CKV1_9ACTN|nr:2-oxo acid dehydrogenase subunit E2 [Nonomuraea soli]MBA2892919.1 2-oxoglutarate dehydrogenase E2 component (dihydrolipoamide succinyltransferase) [Nonomuraea soli]
MTDIRVPRLNSNDADYLLVEWLAGDGREVKEGEPLVVVETSKTAEELESPASGFVRHAVAAGTTVTPGQVIADVTALPHAASAGVAAPARAFAEAPAADGPVITEPARALMAEHGLTDEQVRGLDVPVVRRADIEGLLTAAPAPALSAAPAPAAAASGAVTLSRVQQAVGRAVALSHATIPAAYAVVRMDLGAALQRAARLTREVRRPVGLAELFVHAVAGLHPAFPLFFATLDGDRALLAPAPRVGVTLDLGHGLFVPVVHDTSDLARIAVRLTELRLAAASGTFRAADLDGATIAVTLHTEAEVMLAIPFVFPGHACALAVTAPRPEAVVLPDGTIAARTIAHIGLAYDHRLINGREAASFLGALKEALT